MKSLNIVLKTVERCNLNCSYCYFFNSLDQSYVGRPKFISISTIEHIVNFIRVGIDDLGLEEVTISLHGGEPLMQPKHEFRSMLESFNSLSSLVKIDYVTQTNATLVNQNWIDLLNEYNVGVGVSIDGPQDCHDKYRLDHYGRGSYDSVLRGIELLMKGLNDTPGSLTVINPEFSGREIYKHIVGLGFKRLDFLLPDMNHNLQPSFSITSYSNYLISIFDEWVLDNNPEIHVRKLKSMIRQLLGRKSLTYASGIMSDDHIPLISIRSDGAICSTDELVSTDPNTVLFTGKYVADTSLKEVIDSGNFREIAIAQKTAPQKCMSCKWYMACGAGNLVHRFSDDQRFNNHSIYCEALQDIYTHLYQHLVVSGVPEDGIKNYLSTHPGALI
jgi:uncharacterized protein